MASEEEAGRRPRTGAEAGLVDGADAVAQFEERDQSPLARLQRFLHTHPTAIPAIVLALSLLIFWLIIGDRFLSPFNVSLVLQQVTIIGMVALAQTLVIITAGIDLSVGAIMVLSSVVMGKLAVALGVPVPIAFVLGLACGAACGWLNGSLITKLQLPPFIVTLGTWNIFLALNLWYSESQTIRSQDIEATAPFLQWMGASFGVFGAKLTAGAILMIALYALFWYILAWTAWGRRVYAVGDDVDAARLSGIQTDRILISVYVVAGVICALAAWVSIGRLGSVSPQAGQFTNLDSITAVVIGGASLFGGRGAVIGTLFGALTVGFFRAGLAQAGVDVLWQQFAIGVLIILAVALDQWIRRVSS